MGSIEDAHVDEMLIATWKSVDDEGQTSYMHLGRAGDGEQENLMAFTVAQINDKGVVFSFTQSFFVTKLENMNVANEPVFSDALENMERDLGNVEGYQFMKYTVDEDELHIFSVDRDLVLQAVRDGHLAGTIITTYSEDRVKSEDVRISATSEKIQEFLEGGGTLFEAEPNQSYQRVDD